MIGKLRYNTFMENKDDNRTIADMSGVDQRGLLSSWFGILDPNVRAEHGPGRNRNASSPQNSYGSKPSNGQNASQELSPEDRRALIFYAMKYSFGIGMIFLTIFGIVIFLMTKFWH